MFVPMVSSALSTVITAIPLAFAQVLILSRFAVVIFFTMLVGLAYVIFFLTPVLAIFGPGYRGQTHSHSHQIKITDKTPVLQVIKDTLLQSIALRFFVVTALGMLVFVRFFSDCSMD